MMMSVKSSVEKIKKMSLTEMASILFMGVEVKWDLQMNIYAKQELQLLEEKAQSIVLFM